MSFNLFTRFLRNHNFFKINSITNRHKKSSKMEGKKDYEHDYGNDFYDDEAEKLFQELRDNQHSKKKKVSKSHFEIDNPNYR